VRQNAQAIYSAENKQQIGGNKMDSFNLAMVFGPNLLKKHNHHAKPSAAQFAAQAFGSHLSKAAGGDMASHDKYHLIDDIDAVISVTKYLIENQAHIFSIDSYLHNELIESINKASPSDINSILIRKIISQIGITLLENGIVKQQQEEKPQHIGTTTTTTTTGDGQSTTLVDNESSSSSSYCSSTNELDRLLLPRPTRLMPTTTGPSKAATSYHHNQTIDFIDTHNNTRTSRTKLHKITNNFSNFHLDEPIGGGENLAAAPLPPPGSSNRIELRSFKPGRVSEPLCHQNSQPMLIHQLQQQQQQPQRHIIRNYSNDLLSRMRTQPLSSSDLKENQMHHVKYSGATTTTMTTSATTTPSPSSASLPSSILLMIQSQQSSNESVNVRRSHGNASNGQQQLANSNSVCSKYFEKSNRFNVVGEQETLV
jgi:hypothetical protein